MAEGRGGALRELVAFLGFDLDEKGLDKAEKGVDRLKERSETLTKALELVGVALGAHEIAEFIGSQIEMGDAIEHTSEMLGVSADDLQRFSYAANIADVDSASAANSLGFLNRAIGAAGEGQQEAAKAFSDFHVALKNVDGSARPLSAIVADLADGFAKTDDAGKKTYVAMTLFGRSGRDLIPLLNKGRAGIEGLYSEFDKLGGGLDENFIKSAGEADHAMKEMKFAGRNLSSEIGAFLLPIVTDLAESVAVGLARFREWTQHTHFLRNALITLAAIAGVLVVTWGILNIEILLVVAALALLALAVDDVITFFEDGDSVLGRFLDKLFGVGESKHIAKELRDAWKEVSDAFGKLWDSVKDLGPDLKDLFDTFTNKKSDVTSAKSGIQAMADTVKELADNLRSAVKWFDDMIKKFNGFAKAHPVLVHAYQRQAHEIAQGDPSLFGVVGNLARDVNEGVTGNASDITALDLPNPTGTVAVPTPQTALAGITGQQPVVVQQHNETKATFYGLPGADQALLRLSGVVKDAQTDANNAAFPAVGGGGAP